MSIIRIKNKYLRRIILILAVPLAFVIGVPLAVFYDAVIKAWETWVQLLSAIGDCWRGSYK